VDEKIEKVTEKLNQGIETLFQILNDGLVAMGKTVYLSDNKALKEEILRKTHESRFATHPESTKNI